MNSICNHTIDAFDCDFESFTTEVSLNESTLLDQEFGMFNHCIEGWYGDNETICEDPLYYSYSYRVIGTLFQGIIFLVGVFGNFMVVLVVARTKSMLSPTNCYLVSLAIADSIVLLASIPQELVSYYVVGNQWIWGDMGCALLIFFQHLGINSSTLSLSAFTVERYIAICKPFLAQTVCTVNRAKKIIAGVWIFALIYCFPWLFLTSTFPLYYKGFANIQQCHFKLSREQYLGYYFTDLIVFYIVPLLMSVILYGLIARILYQSHNTKSSNGTNGPLSVDSSKTNAARVQVVKMLGCVVVIFAILWLPYRGLLVYNSLAKERYMDLWYLIFAKTCVFINSAINPILYNAMSRKFRTAFGRVLSCGKNRDFYGRWQYCRTHTTYATASTAVPSMATLNCQMPRARKATPNRHNVHDPPNSPSNNIEFQPTRSTMTYFEVVVDTSENVCTRSDEITQL